MNFKIKKLIVLIGFIVCNAQVTNQLIAEPKATSQREYAEIVSIMSAIKDVATRDKNLRDFFSPNESPESVLDKAKCSARSTRLGDVAQELNSRLIPALEALLHKQRPVAEVQSAIVGQIPMSIRSTKEAAEAVVEGLIEPDEKNIKELKAEVARLSNELVMVQAREKERLEVEYINFMSLIEQAQDDEATGMQAVTEAKERLVLYRYDLERLARNISSMLTDVASYGQIESTKAFFLQQVSNLERGCTSITLATDQLKEAYDVLTKLAKSKAINTAEIQKKAEQGFAYTRIIIKKTEEIYWLVKSLKKGKELAVLAKSDLERQFEIAKAQERKRKRLELE